MRLEAILIREGGGAAAIGLEGGEGAEAFGGIGDEAEEGVDVVRVAFALLARAY